MNEVIATVRSDMMHAAAIWALLVLTGLFALLLFKSKMEESEPMTMRMRMGKSDPAIKQRHAEHTEELIRYAQEVTVAARRAAAMAERRRAEWLTAQAQLEEAWQAYEASEAEARRFCLAGALPTPEAPKTPAEYAFRERFLHRAAMAACSRKQLSPLDLSDALAHRKGWDPTRHPAEQEIVLRRAIRDSMLAGYRSAAKRERAAWRSADLANQAKTSLRQEARLATARASQAAAGKPLALAGDTMILPQFAQHKRPLTDPAAVLPWSEQDKLALTADTIVLPPSKQDAMRALGADTMVLPRLKADPRSLADDTMVLPALG